jgi:hypothetical protein
MSEYHNIYNDFPYIEDEISNLIYIPMMDKSNKVSGYAISNLTLKDKLLKFRYHQAIKLTKNKRRYVISCTGVSMHEIVMGEKAPEGYVIDHIDSNGLLNTEENLRYATSRLNSQNKLKKANTSSKYIGVSFSKDCNKWKSEMKYNYDHLYLGLFEDEIEAAKAYDIHVIHYYKGESPKTNNLLTASEIKNIKYNGIPEKYQKKVRDLPKNISLRKNGRYRVNITSNGKKYEKTVKSLEDAIILKNQILQEIDEQEKIIINNKEITRNKEGLAIIYMSNGLECIVDDGHWHDVSQYKWSCQLTENNKIYGYPSSRVNGKRTELHRYIFEKYVGEIPKDKTIDHFKSDAILDVRLINLRLADDSLQNHNRDMSKGRIDEYKGISFSPSGYQVKVNKRTYGTYKTAEEAAEKANEVYTLIYGEKATLNIIDYSKQTTKYNRIPEENITKEYIMNLTKVADLKNVVIIKGLNTTRNNPKENIDKISLNEIKLTTFNKYKQIIVDKLYPLTD